MKVSYYNIFSKVEENSYVLYNTLYDSLLIIDEEVRDCIANKRIQDLPEVIINGLKKSSILIDDDINERNIYSFKRYYHQYKEERTHILLTVTHSCNCACEYCFEQHKTLNGFLSKPVNENIRRFIVNAIRQNNSKMLQIDFFGGEPFINWKLVEEEIEFYNKWCQRNNVKVLYRFYTNGTILNSNIQTLLLENRDKIKDLQITLDGPKEIHDRLRPLKNKLSCYDKIMENLIELKNLSIPVIIRINFNKSI